MQPTPAQGRITRANFEREFHLIVEQLNQGRLKFSSASLADAIGNIKVLPNRRIDLNTIGSGARAMALLTASYAFRREQGSTQPPAL